MLQYGPPFKELSFTQVWHVLRCAKPHLAIPKEILFTALEGEPLREVFLCAVLGDNREIEVTEELLAFQLQRFESDELMPQVLKRCGPVTVTNSMMLSAVQNGKSGDKMAQLLLSRIEHIEEPTDIITAAVGNERKGFGILQTLEGRFGELEFSHAAIIAASSGSLETVRLILECYPGREIPAQALLGASVNGHISVMKLLLDRIKATVTHEMVFAEIVTLKTRL